MPDHSLIYESPALHVYQDGTLDHARALSLHFPARSWTAQTPMFMQVGTQGTVKGLTPEQLKTAGSQVILGNTYHLTLRPGSKVVADMGDLHGMMQWPYGILTDSGGFQMVSLVDLMEVTEEGVSFQSPHDGSMMLMTPELSIQCQNDLGADIIMALDDVVSSVTTGPRVIEAQERTIRWIDRCIAAHQRPHDQNLFGIVQGGLDVSLRKKCIEAMVQRDLPGYAIGGLSGGEDKNRFWRIVKLCTDLLPSNKPRYLMGVGYPVDLVVCVALGVDMFDCVFASRTARFGVALTSRGAVKIRHGCMRHDLTPIDATCQCFTCKSYSRSYLNLLLSSKNQAAPQLITLHNVTYLMHLMRQLRQAVLEGELVTFVQNFMKVRYEGEMYPTWIVDALESVDIVLLDTI